MGAPEIINLHDFAENAYLRYAIASVKDRALPEVEDGQKPVQRRILYAMHNLGLTADSKPVKSARVVGDVLGKYHPHGDSAAYDAMVRMAQDFTLRYPLMIGQGNFGSRDGDGAAAMRYTEIRLSPVANLLLDEINRGTVDFKENYDGSLMEPVLLPAKLPFVLLNGAIGIAVGMGTSIPPHNLREVAQAAQLAVIKGEKLTLDDILGVMPGPDFPDGAQIISSPDAIRKAYETGSGSVRLRCVWKKEELAKGNWRIVINQLPYQVSTAKILEQLDEITNPQMKKDKKQLSQQQTLLKSASLSLLESAADESCAEEPVRLVIHPKTRAVDENELMTFLFQNTELEKSSSINLTMVGIDGKPGSKSLENILKEWAVFRRQTVTRRCEFDLNKVNARLHILEGRIIVYLNIDEVIEVIRNSDEPKPALMEKFGLSQIQAEDILEIRLRQLARLEKIKLEAEKLDLERERQRLQKLLASEKEMSKLIVAEIEEAANKYGDDRRTLIKEEASSQESKVSAAVLLDEKLTVTVSKQLWTKARAGHGLDPQSIAYKQGDAENFVIETSTAKSLAVFSEDGRLFNLDCSVVPSGRGDGAMLSSLVGLSSKLVSISAIEQGLYLAAGSSGYGFLCEAKALQTKMKAGKAFFKVDDGTTFIGLSSVSDPEDWVVALTKNGRVLRFEVSEIKVLDSGKGSQLMKLDPDDALIKVVLQKKSQQLQYKQSGKFTAMNEADIDLIDGKRAAKGAFLNKKKGLVTDIRAI